ncbi:unnamed protein product, partial [Discosporangium mesarthrocarpum]
MDCGKGVRESCEPQESQEPQEPQGLPDIQGHGDDSSQGGDGVLPWLRKRWEGSTRWRESVLSQLGQAQCRNASGASVAQSAVGEAAGDATEDAAVDARGDRVGQGAAGGGLRDKE